MSKTIRLRALAIDGKVRLKAIFNHPMETGLRKFKKTGKKIPAHYIQEVMVSQNNLLVMEAFWGPSISRNPYLSFETEGKQGDRLTVSWVDNRGNFDTEAVIVR